MSKAITALLAIIGNPDVATRRRIDACEALIGYAAPAEAVAVATTYLTEVFENEDEFVELKLEALELMRKFEAPRVTKPTAAPADDRATIERARKLAYARRRMDLIESGAWTGSEALPEGWADDIASPNWRPPPAKPMPAEIAHMAPAEKFEYWRKRHEASAGCQFKARSGWCERCDSRGTRCIEAAKAAKLAKAAKAGKVKGLRP